MTSLQWAEPVLVTTEPDAPEWRRSRLRRVRPQGSGDLGERLMRAMSDALGTSRAVIAIGADSPGLPTEYLEAARLALESSDAVLGPAKDGGFYLIGLRRAPGNLLDGLPWSSAETFERTWNRLLERGLSVHVLPDWFDVDHSEDLVGLRRRLVRGDIDAPSTARALAGLAPEPSRVSIVIPALDEEARIERQLHSLSGSGAWHEVIVVDGGSRDRTVERARGFPGVRVIESPRGRALQMNAGARVATGDVLLFLHADVELPPGALEQVTAALADPATVAGAFRTWTVEDGPPCRLGPLLHLADLRSRYTGLPYGDQAISVRAGVFERIGGYPDQPLMEDLELSRRLRKAGKIRTVPASVRVSGRRFQSRPIYYFLLVNVLPVLYGAGIPPGRLARLYGDPR
ncbi:MAG: TIGR04283 family arsenosugar biosynthesis glycosyltransferase [Deltaproteobacteria bacterium]|nr:TIGR04283 family arsenosugar biosynthesis glycosyltransferase [Deltaproteobacteria bacterium]